MLFLMLLFNCLSTVNAFPLDNTTIGIPDLSDISITEGFDLLNGVVNFFKPAQEFFNSFQDQIADFGLSPEVIKIISVIIFLIVIFIVLKFLSSILKWVIIILVIWIILQMLGFTF